MTQVEDPVDAAIAALTAAARQRRIIGAGTPAEHEEPVDAGEIICRVVTSVAANLGGAEQLLAGRPGSWEADLVRNMVGSTAGNDEAELLRWRTEPVRIELDVDDVFTDFGIAGLYNDDSMRADDAEDEARVAVFEAAATPAERARVAEIQAIEERLFEAGAPAVDAEADRARFAEFEQIFTRVLQRAEDAGGPLVDALEAAALMADRIDELWEADKVAYTAAYTAAARQRLTDRGLGHLEVQILAPDPSTAWAWDDLVEDVRDHALQNALLPQTGAAPDLTGAGVAEALRKTGATYADRARAALAEG